MIFWGGVSSNKFNLIQLCMSKALRPLMSTNTMYKELKLIKFNYSPLNVIHFCIYESSFNLFQEYFSPLLPKDNYQKKRNLNINFTTIKLELEKRMLIYNFVSI